MRGNILPPAEPTMGFVGYNSSLFCQLSYRNACVSPFNYRHFDELLRDLGAPTRKSRNRLLEAVRPLTLPHYAEHLSGVAGAPKGIHYSAGRRR